MIVMSRQKQHKEQLYSYVNRLGPGCVIYISFRGHIEYPLQSVVWFC